MLLWRFVNVLLFQVCGLNCGFWFCRSNFMVLIVVSGCTTSRSLRRRKCACSRCGCSSISPLTKKWCLTCLPPRSALKILRMAFLFYLMNKSQCRLPITSTTCSTTPWTTTTCCVSSHSSPTSFAPPTGKKSQGAY